MKIEMFALYKDYFDSRFELEPVATIPELRKRLVELNPEASDVLSLARFAVNDRFIDEQFMLSADDTIAVIPPGSGG